VKAGAYMARNFQRPDLSPVIVYQIKRTLLNVWGDYGPVYRAVGHNGHSSPRRAIEITFRLAASKKPGTAWLRHVCVPAAGDKDCLSMAVLYRIVKLQPERLLAAWDHWQGPKRFRVGSVGAGHLRSLEEFLDACKAARLF
jgi:hypothetical protein